MMGSGLRSPGGAEDRRKGRGIPHGDKIVLRDDQMVDELDFHQIQSLAENTGGFEVLTGGQGVPVGMVMGR